jgi:cytoskeletal protein CcmA (bactofilin family)
MLPRDAPKANGSAQPTAEPEAPRETYLAAGAGLLSIGRGISVVGEITSCARLVVDGMVEGNLQRCQDMVIGEGGVFKGEARTENAEISGRVEGNLIVRKRLVIHPSGHVSGITTYGEIEIERGGKIVGELVAREGAQRNGE